MKVNYILLYGTPYLKTKMFEKFDDISKYLISHKIVDYTIFELMDDLKEIEMIHLNNDIHVLEGRIEKAIKYIEFQWEKIFKNEKYSNHLWSVDGLVIKGFLKILKGEDENR